ncbi:MULTISPECIES: aldolase/citrate lyase family protein [Methylosinus]|uniref:Aldolase n=1 Tax=Methylosinus trichosporium (strain ATCC 35070 / NCIMB 11131 / UNIQEM 75 / OB3b) TaxID=595536 RepID=A0A2D2D102_METT3|nr:MULTISPECIES: aldolase/citrate lyase family protein [Methylosinus]ATQ68624.1 aldolase [Methylosinus trichosporium OB3b]OBS50995.1 aldolase [Methylosinus sp. 3S-1]
MRSFLLVTAQSDALDAALESEADALVLDLGGRGDARAAAAAFLARARGRPGPALFVKVAALGGAEIDDDLAAIVAAAAHGVALPRACGGASLQHLSAKLAVAEAMAGRDDGATRILALATQTPAAIFALGDYAGASTRLDALAFDTEELRRALGAAPDDASLREPGSPFAHARAGLRLAAAAAKVAAIDRPFPAQGDPAGLAAECRAARRDGFAGKLAAASWQVREINAAFDGAKATV